MDHAMKAAELFVEGYNCAQAVTVAFCDVTGMEKAYAAKLSSGFGGGIGGLREVCGAVSGMTMVLNHLYGYEDPKNDAAKKQVYSRVQGLAEQFREQNGSIICRELLKNLPANTSSDPKVAEYYAKRPCVRMVMVAAELLDEFIAQHPLEK